MDAHPASRFVLLTTVADPSAARVLAARLLAEGIEVRAHGGGSGPYPVTVGAMAVTRLWVPDDRVEEASLILLDAETKDLLEAHRERASTAPSRDLRLVAGVLVVLVLLAITLRLMQVF